MRALLVGVEFSAYMPDLPACARDAVTLRDVLQRHEDGSPNYDCRLLVNPGGPLVISPTPHGIGRRAVRNRAIRNRAIRNYVQLRRGQYQPSGGAVQVT
jgi:hypothetical protein